MELCRRKWGLFNLCYAAWVFGFFLFLAGKSSAPAWAAWSGHSLLAAAATTAAWGWSGAGPRPRMKLPLLALSALCGVTGALILVLFSP